MLSRQIFKGARILPRNWTCNLTVSEIQEAFKIHSILFISFFLASFTVGHARLVMNFQSNFPGFWDSGSDFFGELKRYRPGQLFWGRYQNNDTQLQQFSQNTFAPTTTVLVGFQHPSEASTCTAQHKQFQAVNSIFPNFSIARVTRYSCYRQG